MCGPQTVCGARCAANPASAAYGASAVSAVSARWTRTFGAANFANFVCLWPPRLLFKAGQQSAFLSPSRSGASNFQLPTGTHNGAHTEPRGQFNLPFPRSPTGRQLSGQLFTLLRPCSSLRNPFLDESERLCLANCCFAACLLPCLQPEPIYYSCNNNDKAAESIPAQCQNAAPFRPRWRGSHGAKKTLCPNWISRPQLVPTCQQSHWLVVGRPIKAASSS